MKIEQEKQILKWFEIRKKMQKCQKLYCSFEFVLLSVKDHWFYLYSN